MIHRVEEEVDLEGTEEVEDLMEEEVVQVLQVDLMVLLLEVLQQVKNIIIDQAEEEVGVKKVDRKDVVVVDNPGAEDRVALEDHQEEEVDIQEEEGLPQLVCLMEHHPEIEDQIMVETVEVLADIKEDLAEEDLLRGQDLINPMIGRRLEQDMVGDHSHN